MLELIRTAPLLFALLSFAGSALVGGAGWFGRGWIFDTFERPAIERAATEACVARVEAAAAKATADEQLRQFRIGEAAFNRAYQEDREAADWHTAQVALLMKEIGDYELERREAGPSGRLCTLTRRDLDFVDGVRQHGAAD